MIIVNGVLFILGFSFIIYRLGSIVSYFTKNKNRNLNFLYGFIVLLGLNQLLLTPCILCHTSFNVAFYLVIIIDMIGMMASFFFPKNDYKRNENLGFTAIVFALVGIQIILAIVFFKWNPDDSFYVSLSQTSIDSESIYREEPSMGYQTDSTLLSVTEQIPSFELQIAIFSKIANVNAAVMCHSIFPVFVIALAYLSFYYFAKSFMKDKNAKIFLIILSVILLFTGFSSKFRAGALFIKPWQGKAIFLNIGISMILANLIRMDKKIKKENVILLAISNLFSMSLTSTAIFLIPFVYLPFGLLKLIKGKGKDILWLILSFAPVIFYILLYIVISLNGQGAFEVPKDEVSILEALQSYNSYCYLIYYVIATIIILFFGTKQAKRYFCYVQGIYLVTIWNPLFSDIIAKYFTSSATFWRVLWLLPIEFAIAYSIVIIIDKVKNKKIKIATIVGCLAVIILSGKFVYQKATIIENLENIPQSVINQTNYLLEKGKEKEEIVVLAPIEPHDMAMRQLTSKIKLIYSRSLYIGKIKNEEDIQERENLNQLYVDSSIYSNEEFKQIVQKKNLDWIIVEKENIKFIQYLEQCNIQKECEMDGYFLFHLENIGNAKKLL